jgi:N,N-dimethylformamidase
MPDRRHVVGYAQPWSLKTSERLEVMLSADQDLVAVARLVRLGSGEVPGETAEFTIRELGGVALKSQSTRIGSCVLVPESPELPDGDSFVAVTLCMPTRTGPRQALLSQCDASSYWWLGLESGVPTVEIGDRHFDTARPSVVVRAPNPLLEGAWYLVAAEFSPNGGPSVVVRPLDPGPSWRIEPTETLRPSRTVGSGSPGAVALRGRLAIAAAPFGESSWAECFDGKLESPSLLRGELDDAAIQLVLATEANDRLICRWELGRAYGWDEAARHSLGRTASNLGGTRVPASGTSPRDGVVRGTPLAGVTGHCWDGSEVDFRIAPRQYEAMHFHADDLDDSGWEPSLAIDISADLPSGVYAVRVEAAGRPIERVPFFVRPATRKADLLVLIPTASYLAYANDHPISDGDFSEATAAQIPLLYEDDLLLHEHREWGLSMYDTHLDGSGVAISSSRRPLMNMRPTHRYHVGPWQLAADLRLTSWLEHQQVSYDLATDSDLDEERGALLAGYSVVMTGTHPEYFSTHMLDAVEEWVRRGGRLVYIGANGFYWRVAFDPQRPWVMELRRGHAGSRAWESAPGETRLMFTGEEGGLWRNLGRPPQKLTGVGYAAQGFDTSGWYRRLPGSIDPRASWIFDGIEDATFGTSGSVGSGAVGQEIDRCDSRLGSPADAIVLATSEGLSEGYLRCVEEVPFTLPGLSARVDPNVRADVVYHVKPGGGAVFSTGSIAWVGSLGEDSGIDRITMNVLSRFLDPRPLPW